MTNELFRSMLKEVIKEVISEVYAEQETIKKKRKVKDSDLISTTEAYNLRGKARVTELIMRGHLNRVSSGRAKNSPKYISKSRLIELDKLHL